MKLRKVALKGCSITSIILASWASHSAYAQEIKLVTGNDYKPYADQTLPEGGLATDIARQAFIKAGYKPVFEFKGWTRAKEEAKRGQYFATFPWTNLPERRAEWDFSEPIIQLKNFGFYAKNNPIKVNSVEEMANLRLCNPFSYAIPTVLKTYVDSGSMLVEDPDWELSCHFMMLRGRVDFVQTSKSLFSAQVATAELDMNQFASTSFPIAVQDLGLMVSKSTNGREEIIAKFNKAMAEMDAAGEIDAIYKKHNVARQ